MIDGTVLGVALGLLQISERKNTERIIEALKPAEMTRAEKIMARTYDFARRSPTYIQGLPNSIPIPAELPEPPPALDDDDDEGSGNI